MKRSNPHSMFDALGRKIDGSADIVRERLCGYTKPSAAALTGDIGALRERVALESRKALASYARHVTRASPRRNVVLKGYRQ